MSDIYVNNYITGTWSSGEAGFGPFAGEVTTFNGTITATGETFTAVYTGVFLTSAPYPDQHQPVASHSMVHLKISLDGHSALQLPLV